MTQNPQQPLAPRLMGAAAAAGEGAGAVGLAAPAGGKLLAWILLAVCLLLACPPLLVELARPDAVDPAEIRDLAVSVQTWGRHHRMASAGGEASGLSAAAPVEWLTPYLNDQVELAHPPAIHWLHGIFFQGLDPAHTRLSTLFFRARLASVVMALIAVACVYWAGQALGGTLNAFFAGMIFLSCPLLIYHGRFASSAMAGMALILLAVAAAVWAIRPLRPAASIERQFLGWVICGLALGFSILTDGLMAAPIAVAPILLILFLCPGRSGHLMGLLAAVVIAALLVLPWALLVQGIEPQAWRAWMSPDTANGSYLVGWRQVGPRLLAAVVAMLPWTLWLLAALAQPVSTSSSGNRTRQRMWLAWAWLLITMIFFVVLPGVARSQYLLAIIAAAAVLIGQLFTHYQELLDQARHPRSWRVTRWLHSGLLVGLSLVPLYLMRGAEHWPEWAYLPAYPIQLSRLKFWLLPGLSAALLLGVGLSVAWAVGHRSTRVLITWALWGWALTTVMIMPLARGPLAENPLRAQTKELLAACGAQPVYWLISARRENQPMERALLLFARRTIPTIRPDQIDEAAAEAASFCVLADAAGNAPPGTTHHPTKILYQSPQLGRVLWQYAPAVAGVTENNEPNPVSDNP
ncbi:MAG: hypothetical protein IT443_02920 [Phycisphaeraceae bacterium]|nr:hypothetical protein [Phycisphaeraceae bacterium]